MNLARTLDYAAERMPDAEAVVDGPLRMSYSRLRERVARLAGGLAALGVGRGDPVATVLKNRHENVELCWAWQWRQWPYISLLNRVSVHH